VIWWRRNFSTCLCGPELFEQLERVALTPKLPAHPRTSRLLATLFEDYGLEGL
jgi:hypothetical protein